MSSSQQKLIDSLLRELLNAIDNAKYHKMSRDEVLKLLDEVESNVDVLIQMSSPERITDERFTVAVNALKDLSNKFRSLREKIVFEDYINAKSLVLDVQETIKHLYRLLSFIRAGAPSPVIFQVAPQFLREAPVPEALIYGGNPMEAQIYNVLMRKGQASVEELALELKIDDKSRDEFNRALSRLAEIGYIRMYITPDNKIVFRPAR